MTLFDHYKKNNKVKLLFTIVILTWIIFVFLAFFFLDKYDKNILLSESNAANETFTGIFREYDNILENFSVYINPDTLQDFSEEEFNHISEQYYLDGYGILSISYAPSAEVEYIYPNDNEYSNVNDDLFTQALGIERDLLEDSISNKDNVFYFDDSHDSSIIRLYKPIYVNNTFNGFILLIIDANEIREEVLDFGGNEYNAVILTEKNEEIINPYNVNINNLNVFNLEGTDYPIIYALYAVDEYESTVARYMVLYIIVITIIFLTILIYSVKDIVNTSKLIKKLNYKTDHDDRFNIYNYQKMNDDINELIKENTHFYFAFGNVNNLKYIFNKFGHSIGNKLLMNVITKVHSVLSTNTTFYRYGGDEFAFVIKSTEKFEVNNILSRVLRLFDSEIASGKIRGNLSLSLGVVSFPDQANSFEELLNKANIIMASTQSFNKNSFEFYSREGVQDLIHNQDIDTYLSSIPIDKFEIYLMPIVNALSNKVEGFECLSRLFDEFGNLLNIPDVISSFERNGRIQELDEYAFKKTCEYKVKLDTLFSENYFLTTNVSGLSFNQRYVDTIIDIYEHYENLNNNIIVELTESNKFEDLEFLYVLFDKMTSANINLAIDDFGTGYSSLQSLSKTPAKIIKIDKSFVQGIDLDPFNRQLIQIVQGLSKTLKMSICAEGVDSIDQREFIREVGCEYYQGYLFSKAISFEEVVILLNEEKTKIKRGKKNEK